MNNKGFTLIELLAIVLLLAIIATVGTYAVSSYIESSRKASDKILWENIKTASKQYIDECTSGVSTLSCSIPLGANPATINTTIQTIANNGFLNSVTNDSGNIVVLDSNKNNIGTCKITIVRTTDANYNVSYSVTTENNDRCKNIKNKNESF